MWKNDGNGITAYFAGSFSISHIYGFTHTIDYYSTTIRLEYDDTVSVKNLATAYFIQYFSW